MENKGFVRFIMKYLIRNSVMERRGDKTLFCVPEIIKETKGRG
jgi:hypothetical protein